MSGNNYVIVGLSKLLGPASTTHLAVDPNSLPD
jgi:hypothetical protein